jgi:hypothetical protein
MTRFGLWYRFCEVFLYHNVEIIVGLTQGCKTCLHFKAMEAVSTSETLVRLYHTTECRGRAVNTPVSYAEGPGLKSQPR